MEITFSVLKPKHMELTCWITIANPDDDLKYLANADEIVAPATIKIVYDYPLNNPVTVEHCSANEAGFTRAELALTIAKQYQKIYREENAVDNPGHIPGMFNRATSKGPYGIWGHGIEDLMLTTVYITKKGKVPTYGLNLDS